MTTFFLIVLWIIIGLIVGILGLAAHLKPRAWGRPGWLWLLGLSVGAALLGGATGGLLLGRVFATPTALWLAVLVVCAPAISTFLKNRGQRSA